MTAHSPRRSDSTSSAWASASPPLRRATSAPSSPSAMLMRSSSPLLTSPSISLRRRSMRAERVAADDSAIDLMRSTEEAAPSCPSLIRRCTSRMAASVRSVAPARSTFFCPSVSDTTTAFVCAASSALSSSRLAMSSFSTASLSPSVSASAARAICSASVPSPSLSRAARRARRSRITCMCRPSVSRSSVRRSLSTSCSAFPRAMAASWWVLLASSDRCNATSRSSTSMISRAGRCCSTSRTTSPSCISWRARDSWSRRTRGRFWSAASRASMASRDSPCIRTSSPIWTLQRSTTLCIFR
mmetsp:Transcript_19903/g.48218  ORF Transcript_19903/g.48218 Transcript_19903/m.48218 type:complete len:300 (-) Transcript_19903:181-1080(-)